MKLRTRYSLEKYDLLKAECEIRREQQNRTSVLNCYSHSQKFDFHTDLSFAVMACVDICMKIYIPRKPHTEITIGTGLSADVIIGNVLLKNLIAIERPCWINETVNMFISIPQDYSFPSGHTLSSFIVATIIMHHDKRMGIAAYVLASMIAFSRLYLYVHFPSDVLAGVLIGVIIGTVSNVISDKIFSYVEKRTS